MINIQERSGSIEKQIITAMIVSDRVLGRLAPKWEKEGMFKSTWCNLVGNWCVRYFKRYERAPRKQIVGMFEAWAEHHNDRSTIKLLERFLSSLSGEYQNLRKGINTEFIVDLAGEHFNETVLRRTTAAIEGDIAAGKIKDALQRIARFNSVDVGVGAGISVLSDRQSIRDVLDDSRDVLFRYPGALGKFFGNSLERDGFLAFMGPEKRGKTFWLLDMAWRAMMAGVKVAFFEVGDLSRKQIMRRFYTRACKRPLKRTREYNPLRFAKSIELSGDDKGFQIVPDMATKHFKTDVTEEEVYQRLRKIGLRVNDPNLLQVSVHPNSSISVAGIRNVLKEWEAAGQKLPGVVCIDYADILAAPAGFQGESRDAINENWKAMRRMSQELHCLVVTATQANAQSYKAEMLGMEHFSEDKRKFAHVTGMIGLNQKDEEKRDGITRLNWLVLREDEFSVTRECFAAGCLGIANPAIMSAMR